MSASKRAAGRRAADVVESGQKVGLGTGSTVFFALERLGERIREEGLEICGVPTSIDTETKAREFGIPLATLDEVERFDVTIDGADEIDGDYAMIKGGGGALLREKVVAAATDHMVVVVGPDKVVGTLGSTFDLPVEVVPFARAAVARGIRALGGDPRLREADGAVYLTDNGNEILDVHFSEGIADAAALELALDAIPGVVESGLFIGLARTLVVGHDDGSADLRKKGT
ncbi:MAG: ribose-5-phosphate isomerase RpiA [Planctomycetota bacterium]|jgi:ribose 5-phosphate isomerase A